MTDHVTSISGTCMVEGKNQPTQGVLYPLCAHRRWGNRIIMNTQINNIVMFKMGAHNFVGRDHQCIKSTSGFPFPTTRLATIDS